ncbi:MAG: glycosyltransferase family 4 protein [Omnitrophica bacterium]|nr:glycosyltransferase family 4 protein [Candidatus Omnitrophota bacterium]
MKILVVGAVLDSRWFGGEPLVAHTIVNGLRERGFVVASYGAMRSNKVGLKDVLRYDYSNDKAYNFYIALLKREKPDIVLGFYDYDCSIYLASLKLKIPFVVSVNIYWPICYLWYFYIKNQGVCEGSSFLKCVRHMCGFRYSTKTIIVNALNYFKFLSVFAVLSKAKAILVPSIFVKKRLSLAEYKNVYKVRHGINLNDVNHAPWNNQEKIVFYPCGYDEEQKGLAHFLDMARKLRKHFGTEIKFTALGYSGDEFVKGFPKIPRSAALGLMEEAYVVVVPPLWDEPFGLTVVEAMAAGKAVVAYNSGAIPEIIEDGITGFLVTKGDVVSLAQKVKHLIEHEELTKKMGQEGRKRAESLYSSEGMIEDYVALLESSS